MYESDYAPLSLANGDGTNSPFTHQKTITKLVVELGILYYHKKTTKLAPLPQTPLSEGPGHAVPDVILYDEIGEETKIIIEVCQTNGQRNDLRKVIRLIEENDYGILEGFVYNYKTHEWLRYCKGDGGVSTNSSVSEVLSVDLGPFV